MEWLKKILGGSKNERDLKNMGPMVDKINSFDESFISLNDQELKNKTNEFRERLNGGETLDDIKPEAFDILMAVYDLMTKYGNTDFLIEGHTDTSGPKVFNDKLSLDRANEVKSHLIEKGVDSDRLSTVGFGEDKPKVSNSTRKGRIANRRVEFKVVE